MAFTKKTWKDRVAEYINRRRLVDVDTSETQTVSVIREEGTVSEAGDAFNATNMNDLESRIETAFGALSASDVAYDNTNSGMTADDVQEAIDGMGTFVNTVQADYSLNTTANTIVGAINENVAYDNTTSGLSATTKQEAIDECAAKVARIFNLTYNSNQPCYVPVTNRWGTYFIMGFLQGIGAEALLVLVDNFVVSDVIDLSTGSSFSSASVTFTYTSAGLKVEGTSASDSTITAIC